MRILVSLGGVEVSLRVSLRAGSRAAMVLLRMPRWAYDLDYDDTEVVSWGDLARAQLQRQGTWWDQFEEGDCLAIEDRESFSQPWPGNRRFVVYVDQDERLALFSEEGHPVDRPDSTPDGLLKMSAWDMEFTISGDYYYRLPPASSCEHMPILPDFSVAYTAELDADAIDACIGYLQPCDDDGDAAAPIAAAPAEAPAPAERSELAVRGTRVVIQGDAGVVFKVNKLYVGVAYDKRYWLAWRHPDFAIVATLEKHMPGAGAVTDVILSAMDKTYKPEGILYGMGQVASPHAWQWFDRYEPRAADADPKMWAKPRLASALEAGQQVECTGKMLAAAGEGPIFLVALAQAKEKAKGEDKSSQWRRAAVVAVAGKLCMAELLGKDCGYVTSSNPPLTLPAEQLRPLQAGVSAFLAQKNVSTLQTQFSRASLRESAPPQRRSARVPPKPSAAAASAPASASAAKCPQLPYDLYGVRERDLAAYPLEHLLELCASRKLSTPPSADVVALVRVLIAHRNRAGRHRRSTSGTPASDAASSTPASLRRGGVGSGTDGESDSDSELEREQDLKRRKARKARKQAATHAVAAAEREARMRKHKKHKKRRRKSSGSSDSNSARSPSPKQKMGSPSSSCSTPYEVIKARHELASIEAAKVARLQAQVDRHERKAHEKRQKLKRSRARNIESLM